MRRRYPLKLHGFSVYVSKPGRVISLAYIFRTTFFSQIPRPSLVMSTNSTTESGSSSFPTISLGNGLVELTALTTLVGSSITESFVLGNHGSVGLAWAPMSSFGIISVIKGCISGASPGWLRQTLGLRTTASDTAVGLDIGMQLRGRSIAQLVKGTPHNTPVGICRTNTKKASDF